MVYRRRSFRRGRRFRRYRGGGRRFARKVTRIAKRAVWKAAETKSVTYTNVSSTYGSVSTTWVENNFEGVGQGTARDQRVGAKIAIRSLWIEGIFTQGSNGTSADDMWNVLRIVIALWRKEAGTTPFASQAVTVPGLNHPIVKGDDTCIGMIKKYYDKTFKLETNGVERASGDGYCPRLYKFKYYKRFRKPIVMTWPGNNGADPNCRLRMSMLSDSTAIVNPGFISGFSRITFKDL